MTHVSDEDVRTQLRKMAPSRIHEINDIEFGEIKKYAPICLSNLRQRLTLTHFISMEKSVRDDINIVKSSPYLRITDVHGYVLDLEHGTL